MNETMGDDSLDQFEPSLINILRRHVKDNHCGRTTHTTAFIALIAFERVGIGG